MTGEVWHWDRNPRGGKSNNYRLGWSDGSSLIWSHREHSVLSATVGGGREEEAPGGGSSDFIERVQGKYNPTAVV